MNFDKESEYRIFFVFLFHFLRGGDADVAGGYEHDSCHIFYTRHIVTTSSIELYSLMKIFLMVFKIGGIVALTIKGR